MSDAQLEITTYLTAPAIDVASGVALGVALLSALPKPAPAPMLRAAKRLRESTVALQKAWQTTHAAGGSSVDRRAADHRIAVAWHALWERLSAYTELPPEEYPRAGRAVTLARKMFSDGLRFLRLPCSRQWAESDRRLTLISDQKTETALRDLVGDDFVDELKQAHAEYGAALGISWTQPVPPDIARVQAPLCDLQAAVRDYALQAVAAANDGRAFTEAARAALAPIDRMHAAMKTWSTSAAFKPAPRNPLPSVTPTSPVPAVPEA